MTSQHQATYNARVIQARHLHKGLLILRVLPDEPLPEFQPGQYTVLGLNASEPRVDGLQLPDEKARLVRRAYSISCPMLNDSGELVTCNGLPYLEFYIALVQRPLDSPPMLTPRLFALEEGDRLLVGPHPHGNYTLEHVQESEDLLFFGTGTGEAPHNAMIAELLARGHTGRILCATCVRYRRDLGYLAAHEELQRRFANYRYIPLTTREPENLDSARPDYVGKRYLQDFIQSQQFRDMLGGRLQPERTRAFLCGNPAMIGLPRRDPAGGMIFPEPHGMIEALVDLGLEYAAHGPGRIHFEKYW